MYDTTNFPNTVSAIYLYSAIYYIFQCYFINVLQMLARYLVTTWLSKQIFLIIF